MGLLLNPKPLLSLGLLLGHPLPDLVHQDLPATTGNAIESGRAQLPYNIRDRQVEPLAEEDDFRGREPVDVDWMVLLDIAHQLQIPLERDVRVVTALQQDLHPTNRLALVDLGADLFE